MSDRIAVIADGKVEQVGSPAEIYARPATAYVAGFLGSANIFDAHVTDVSSGTATCTSLGRTVAAEVSADCPRGDAAIVVRPERIAVAEESAPGPQGHNRLTGTVLDVVYLGAATQVRVDVAMNGQSQQVLLIQVANQAGPQSFTAARGDRVACWFSPTAVQVLRRSDAKLPDPVEAEATA
jgi:spermidine/putrescine transport system ATP-binding protein